MKNSPPLFVTSLFRHELLMAVISILLIVMAEFVGVLQPFRGSLEKILRPFQRLGISLVQTARSPFSYVQSLQTAQRRVQDLEYRYAEASALLSQLDQVQAENQALREMLNASDVTLQKRVITVPIVSYGRPLIAGGSHEGVQSGQMVLVAQTLVGVVTTVFDDQAEIGLLSQETTQPVLAHTESGVQGLIVGDGKRVLLTELPIDAPVTIGERVVTDGQAGISRDILVGRVATVANSPSAATKVAVVEQLVSFYETSLLEVR